MMIEGESILPSIYKVKEEDEDRVFEQLEKFFNLATKQIDSTN